MVNKKLKRVNEKSMLFVVFILLAVLALGSLFVMKPKLTGFVVGDGVVNGTEECDGGTGCTDGVCDEGYVPTDPLSLDCQLIVECGDGVVEEEEVCDDGNDAEDDLCSSTCVLTSCGDGVVQNPNGEDVAEVCDDGNVVEGDGCSDSCVIEESDCGDSLVWGDEVCDDGVNDGSYDSCNDDCLGFGPHCGDSIINGTEVCDDGNDAENDLCSNACVLTLCGDGIVQTPNGENVTEVCDDGEDNGDYNSCKTDCSGQGPSCGDGNCDSAESCSSCSGDCGQCEEEEEEEEDEETTSSADVTGNTIDDTTSSCVSNWECSGWSECSVGGTQTRTCTDTNNCVAEEGRPTESQSCTVPETPEVPETCSDGMKNQDEKGIDCGGVCEKRCSFFTIVGSAINIPFNSSKQFIEDNKVISFSILGIIALIVIWIIIVKVFLKKKNIFFFLEKMNFLGRIKKTKMSNPNP